MSVSRRISIAWSGGDTGEDTDTIVLTGHTYFVDMRVKKDSDPVVLDWAFAGTRSATKLADGSSRCTWTHAVDSRTRDPSADEGLVSIDPDNPLLSVERGRMLNPRNGRIESHEEVWLDEALPSGTQVAFLEAADGEGFIGMIGDWKQGVGSWWSWRSRAGNLLYEIGGNGKGKEVELEGDISVGDKLGQWIVREYWKT